MAPREQIETELAALAVSSGGLRTIATVSTTSGDSRKFVVLPRRQALGFSAICFQTSDAVSAKQCFEALDGRVEIILADAESKSAPNIWTIAWGVVSTSKLYPFKPNDSTIEAAMLTIRRHFDEVLLDRRILIFGNGNLAAKMALRLAEYGALVHMQGRNSAKVERLAQTLNSILPRQSGDRIFAAPPQGRQPYDALISFVSISAAIGPEWAGEIVPKGLVMDGGIGNLSPKFFSAGRARELQMSRLDVRSGFAYTVLPLIEETRHFFETIRGTRKVGGIQFAAGGVIADRGTIVVDRIDKPTQLIGMADGAGGLFDTLHLQPAERQKLQTAASMLADWK